MGGKTDKMLMGESDQVNGRHSDRFTTNRHPLAALLTWLLIAGGSGVLLARGLRQDKVGGLMLAAGNGVLFLRDGALALTGTPRRLSPIPRLLLFAEVATAGIALAAGLRSWVWQPFSERTLTIEPAISAEASVVEAAPQKDAQALLESTPGTQPTATEAQSGRIVSVKIAASIATIVLHTIRIAIFLSPGRGRSKVHRHESVHDTTNVAANVLNSSTR
jgi:hypothetical protein